MRLFASYIRSRLILIAAAVLMLLVSNISKILFDEPSIVIVYPLALCALMLVTAIAVDFIAFYTRHKSLKHDEFPENTNAIEEEYIRMINSLKEEAATERNKSVAEYHDMIMYYTLWAHQIKTPIAAMRLQLQSEDSHSSRQISADLNRIEAYVEMVLTYLRLDSDSTDYVIRECGLDDIIRPSVKKFRHEFILKKLKLDYEPINFKVITDEKWLVFIIEQVISNAIKYTDEGEVRIKMRTPGILTIEDTGIGIAYEDLPRIFENGYTGFNGREDKRASGIGLYLCKRIADNLGHGISAMSKPGEGTVISLDLNTKLINIE